MLKGDYKKLLENEALRENAGDLSFSYRKLLTDKIRQGKLAGDLDGVVDLEKELKTATKISLTLSSIENQKLVIAEYPNKIKTIKKEGI